MDSCKKGNRKKGEWRRELHWGKSNQIMKLTSCTLNGLKVITNLKRALCTGWWSLHASLVACITNLCELLCIPSLLTFPSPILPELMTPLHKLLPPSKSSIWWGVYFFFKGHLYLSKRYHYPPSKCWSQKFKYKSTLIPWFLSLPHSHIHLSAPSLDISTSNIFSNPGHSISTATTLV